MTKILGLLFVCLLQTFLVKAQEPCKLDRASEDIQQLIKQHKANMPEKKFVELNELRIEEDGTGNRRIVDAQNSIKFSFMGGSMFRYYTYSSGVDAKILLKQRTGGFHEKQEEKTFLEVVKKGSDNNISYYDYDFEEDNDFLLTFFPVNESKGCAILIVYQIVDKDWQQKFRRNVD